MSKETLMFDFSSFYSRMAKELPNNCRLVEVGIANGDSMLFLAQQLYSLGKDFKIYGVDSMQYGQYEQMKEIYTNVIKSGLGEYVEIVPYPSLSAASMFNDGYFDLIFIDSSHTYPETAKEIIAWHSKCKDEGIVSGHDYNAEEVNRSVHEVIPEYFTRTDIPDREFEPEKILHTEHTTNGWGVWWYRKQWYLQLNNIK